MMFQLTDVSVTHHSIPALHHITCEVKGAEVTVVQGPTGAGKSTLLQVLHADVLPTSGEVTINGVATHRIRGRKRRELYRSIGVVPQHAQLVPIYTVFQNVLMVYALRGMSKTDATRHALELVAEIGISHCREKLPSQLSGGERQLVALACALALEPTTLLADEPTSMLDADTIRRIGTVINIRVGRGMGVVLSTHHDALARLLPVSTQLYINEGILTHQPQPES